MPLPPSTKVPQSDDDDDKEKELLQSLRDQQNQDELKLQPS